MKFSLETDHKPLISLFGAKHLGTAYLPGYSDSAYAWQGSTIPSNMSLENLCTLQTHFQDLHLLLKKVIFYFRMKPRQWWKQLFATYQPQQGDWNFTEKHKLRIKYAPPSSPTAKEGGWRERMMWKQILDPIGQPEGSWHWAKIYYSMGKELLLQNPYKKRLWRRYT